MSVGVAEGIYRALEEGFARARPAGSDVVRCAGVGEQTASFEFAGEALADVWGAGLNLRSAAPESPALSVKLWDSQTTGVPAPRLPQVDSPGSSVERVDTWLDGRWRAFSAAQFGMAAAWDSEKRTAFAWVDSPASVPPWEIAGPLRPLWAWWADSTGAVMAHGAAVGDASGVVLLAGPGGAGKSTTALACLRAGLKFAGDDYVLLRPGPEVTEVIGLFPTAKVVESHMRTLLPDFSASALPPFPGFPKRVVVLRGPRRDLFLERAPLNAIVIPSVSKSGTVALSRISSGAALRSFGPSSVLQIPGAGAAAFARLGAVAARVPAWSLEVGPDLDKVVAAVRTVLGAGRSN